MELPMIPSPLNVVDRTFAPAGQILRSMIPGTVPNQPHLLATHPAAMYLPSGQAPVEEDSASSRSQAAAATAARDLHRDLVVQLGGLGVGFVLGVYLTLRCK